MFCFVMGLIGFFGGKYNLIKWGNEEKKIHELISYTELSARTPKILQNVLETTTFV